MNNRIYAKEVSKTWLEEQGVEYVSTDGQNIIINGEVAKLTETPSGKKKYLNVSVLNLGAHIINYVWNSEEGVKPLGKVVHHKDKNPFNNDIGNLECVTPRENLYKDHPDWNTRELKCDLKKPRIHYENKLAEQEALYEEAKRIHDSHATHLHRSHAANLRANLKYYDNHLEEAKAIQAAIAQKEAEKKVRQERAQKKRELKQIVDSAHRYYTEVKNAYGKDDPIVYKFWGDWKYAIAEYRGFCEEMKKAE